MIQIIPKEEFKKIIDNVKVDIHIDLDFIYEVYDTVINGINDLNSGNVFNINQIEIINYCIGEYIYTIGHLNEEGKDAFITKEDNIVKMASIVADKYLSLSTFNHHERRVMNLYLPPISTLNLYLNFMLNILNGYSKNDPATTLVSDLLDKSISISRCILSLLVDGYVTEAFASWRTLHECECTLVLLEKYGDQLIKSYLHHMDYAIAYKNGYQDKEKQDAIFVEIKSNMASHNLKSKDMKKYIEYGWLYTIEDFNEENGYKLNFKDGLEKISGVTQYGDLYNLSSEIVHATPMLIYPNRDYFYYLTLLTLYESFFRLERSFVALLSSRVSKEQFARYLSMRQLYYSMLLEIYNREKAVFINKKKGN